MHPGKVVGLQKAKPLSLNQGLLRYESLQCYFYTGTVHTRDEIDFGINFNDLWFANKKLLHEGVSVSLLF